MIPELGAKKSVTWNFYMDDLQENSRYDMIIGRDLLLELKLDLCFSDYMIKGHGGAYKGCTAPMKDIYNFCDDASFINEEVW